MRLTFKVRPKSAESWKALQALQEKIKKDFEEIKQKQKNVVKTRFRKAVNVVPKVFTAELEPTGSEDYHYFHVDVLIDHALFNKITGTQAGCIAYVAWLLKFSQKFGKWVKKNEGVELDFTAEYPEWVNAPKLRALRRKFGPIRILKLFGGKLKDLFKRGGENGA